MKYYRSRDGWNGVAAETYQDGQDLVAKFRLFEGKNEATVD